MALASAQHSPSLLVSPPSSTSWSKACQQPRQTRVLHDGQVVAVRSKKVESVEDVVRVGCERERTESAIGSAHAWERKIETTRTSPPETRGTAIPAAHLPHVTLAPGPPPTKSVLCASSRT